MIHIFLLSISGGYNSIADRSITPSTAFTPLNNNSGGGSSKANVANNDSDRNPYKGRGKVYQTAVEEA